MVVQQIQEVPCQHKTDELRQEILNMIPRFEIKPLFRRAHLKREQVKAFIGARGDGKSAGSATDGLIDHMFWGQKVWSNMSIKCDIEIDDETAQKYGLRHGGVAHFASEPLEKGALLRLDDKYRGGCLVIEEINVQYSNVRRFMTNTNVDFNMVVQELRHLGTSLIYNVIDEMFIDSQLRSLTDAFIKVEDTAYSLENLEKKKQPGLDFKWLVYPMSASIAGREQSYYVTKKPLLPWYFHFGRFRGIYNDKELQRKGLYSESKQGGKVEITAQSSPEMVAEHDEWGWLDEKILQLKDAEMYRITASDLWQHLELADLHLSPNSKELSARLKSRGIKRTRWDNHMHDYWYELDSFKLSGEEEVAERVTALV